MKAEFKVRADLDPTLRRGVFAEPGKSWNAWVRFSNGNAYPQFDSKNDARGMAIKLLDVPGEKLLPGRGHDGEQDFVMFNQPVFFIRDIAEYRQNFAAQADGKKALAFFPNWNPASWELRHLLIALRTLAPPGQPAARRLQRHLAVQAGRTQHQVPRHPRPGEMPGLPATEAEPGPAQLPPRRPVPATLHRPHPACYAFQVQRQDPAKYMPIEDTSVEWKESDAPFATIADIIVPAQDFDSREQNLFCDNLSFNPGTRCRSIGRSAGSTGCGRRFTRRSVGIGWGGMGEGLGRWKVAAYGGSYWY